MNDEVIVIQKKDKVDKAVTIISCITSIGATLVAGLGLFITIPNVIKNNQEQTQVVIEPREGDIIVKDGDDFKLLQTIKLSDIQFPTKVQELQIKSENSIKENRVDLNNFKKEDWANRDSFQYILDKFVIDPNKVINLLDNLDSIFLFCDFYESKNIASKYTVDKPFSFNLIEDKNNFSVSLQNIASKYEYVTKEANDGVEWVKIRVDISYFINEQKITDSLSSDWIETSPDFF